MRVMSCSHPSQVADLAQFVAKAQHFARKLDHGDECGISVCDREHSLRAFEHSLGQYLSERLSADASMANAAFNIDALVGAALYGGQALDEVCRQILPTGF